jgi:hypothetical protein
VNGTGAPSVKITEGEIHAEARRMTFLLDFSANELRHQR